MNASQYYSTPDLHYDFSTARPGPSNLLPSNPLPSNLLESDCLPITCTKNRNNPAWPAIIMAIVGFALAIYTAIGPNIHQHLAVFGTIFIVLWTLMWCIILWVLWKAGQYTETWGLLILPLVLVFLFFMIVVVEW